MAWDRKERLEALIKEKVAVIVLERLSDPRLGFVTITGVQLSKDKRYAKVLFTVLGTPNERRTTERALQDAARHVQEQLAPTLRLRMMPELRFAYDESIERESRMLDLLDDIASRRRPAGADGEPSLADAEAAAEPSSSRGESGADEAGMDDNDLSDKSRGTPGKGASGDDDQPTRRSQPDDR